MKLRAIAPWLFLASLAVAFTSLWQLQVRIDDRRSALHEEQDDVVLHSPKFLKAVSLEFAPLIAALYWTRTVQYYGEKRLRQEVNLNSLWPLLDITTTLDPNLLIAYRYGSTLLSEAPPQGVGRPDLAITLIERGIRANPDYWRFYQDLGFIYYINVKDYAKASQAFLEGSKNPHAQIWMKVMAARIASEGDSLDTSTFLWTEVYNSTTDANVIKIATEHLQSLRAEQDCRQLDDLAVQYLKRFGSMPTAVSDLIRARIIPGAPVDPLGYPYIFGEGGKAETNPGSPVKLDRRPLLQSRN